MIKLIPLALILIAISVGVYLLNQPQVFKSKATGSSLEVGFNVTGITHYGYPDFFPYSQTSQIDADLAEIKNMNGKIIRVFVANNKIPDSEAARRLDVFLTKAATYNISVIVSFIDFYQSGFNPQGTDQFYTGVWNNIHLLGPEFFSSGYRDRYMTFVRTVVTTNKDHPNIYAWEPGNELTNSSSPQTFISFMQDVSSTIKSIDPNHNIATGMLNAGHTALTPSQLYPALTNFNIVTVHSYNGDHSGASDVNWAISNSKTAIIEEGGFGGTTDRSAAIHSDLDFWKTQGATAFLQWGFIAQGISDNGNGDRDLGMDSIWHTDYSPLFSLYKSYNFSVAPACDPNQVQMNVTPNPANQGSPVTFNLSGSQGSTYVEDSWSGGVDCIGAFWGSKTCNATTGGSFSWTHGWKNCAPNDCSVTSAQCFKTASYNVNGEVVLSPTPTPTPFITPTAIPTPAVQTNITVSDIYMYSNTVKRVRYVYTAVTVVDRSNNAPIDQATVNLTLKIPSGLSTNYSGATDTTGKITFRTQTKTKGTFTSTITSVTKAGYIYQPTIITKSLVVK